MNTTSLSVFKNLLRSLVGLGIFSFGVAILA